MRILHVSAASAAATRSGVATSELQGPNDTTEEWWAPESHPAGLCARSRALHRGVCSHEQRSCPVGAGETRDSGGDRSSDPRFGTGSRRGRSRGAVAAALAVAQALRRREPAAAARAPASRISLPGEAGGGSRSNRGGGCGEGGGHCRCGGSHGLHARRDQRGHARRRPAPCERGAGDRSLSPGGRGDDRPYYS